MTVRIRCLGLDLYQLLITAGSGSTKLGVSEYDENCSRTHWFIVRCMVSNLYRVRFVIWRICDREMVVYA
jgi:hypothetical protein